VKNSEHDTHLQSPLAAGGPRPRVDVAVILVNYNSSAFTMDCLASIAAFSVTSSEEGPSRHVVVVDNHSNEKEYQLIAGVQERFPGVTLVRSNINLGFSGANMLATQLLDARYFFFLNNDTVFINDVIGTLFRFMESDLHAGVCTAQMFDGNYSFTKSFHYFPNIVESVLGVGFARLLMPGRYPTNRKKYEEPVSVPYVTGSAMFCRSSALAAVGGLDVTQFLYWEEQDLCMRVHKAGMTVYLVPQAQFVHFYGKSTARNYRIATEEMISMFHFLRKHYSLLHRGSLRLFYFFKHIRKFYKGFDYVRLAFFVLAGAPMAASLRYDQKMDL
jgi:GT2 family glycosyltransferase